MIRRGYLRDSVLLLAAGLLLFVVSVAFWASLPSNGRVLLSEQRSRIVCDGWPCFAHPHAPANVYGVGSSAVDIVDIVSIGTRQVNGSTVSEKSTYRMEFSNSSICVTPSIPPFFNASGNPYPACPNFSIPPYLSLGWVLFIGSLLMITGGTILLADSLTSKITQMHSQTIPQSLQS